MKLQEIKQEKPKVAEINLEKQTMRWLFAQEELKKLAEEASKNGILTHETLDDFGRVKKVLANVRSDLISSQKALASSREKSEEQEELLKKQLIELEEQKASVMRRI